MQEFFKYNLPLALQDVTHDVNDLNMRVRNARVQDATPNLDVIGIVNEWLVSERSLDRGEILSRVLRLPQAWQHILLEYIQGDASYQSPPRITVRLQNAGTTSVRVLAATHSVPVLRSASTTTELADVIKTWNVLEPGESLEQGTKMAVINLLKNGLYSWPTDRWARQTSAGRCLVETGYSATWTQLVSPNEFGYTGRNEIVTAPTKPNEISSIEWQRKRREELTAMAREAKKAGQDANGILAQIRPWWLS